jgi:threonine dehydrogenase-like Zn-dependent dehydrogenase
VQALYVDGRVSLKELPPPTPAADEVLIRVRLAGICRTDLEVLRGYQDFVGVPGHEFVGEAVGPAGSPWLGRRLVGEINVACGRCPRCAAGLARHCLTRRVLGLRGLNGSFAEYLVLPAANVLEVPPQVADEVAVFTEPLAAALAAPRAVPEPARRALVVGDGVIGLLTSWVLALGGAEVHLAGHYREHLDLGGRYGVRGYLDTELPAGEYDLVVEASGSPAGLQLALVRVRPQGTVVLKSTFQGEWAISPTLLVVPEVRLVGSRCGPLDAALRLLAHGVIDPRPLITGTMPLSQGPAALKRAGQPGALKVLLAGRR